MNTRTPEPKNSIPSFQQQQRLIARAHALRALAIKGLARAAFRRIGRLIGLRAGSAPRRHVELPGARHAGTAA